MVETLTRVQEMDEKDELRAFRSEFYLPEINGAPAIYFCGNSLGLQPKRTEAFIQEELANWRNKGVRGHFSGGKPWVEYHHLFKPVLGKLLGARESEVLAMGALTANLHLMLASFFQPHGKRVKVIMEKGAFPSDFYAIYSHMANKGVDPNKHLIELAPNEKQYLSPQDIIDAIQATGEELALVLLPGVQYYTGQYFCPKPLVQAAHEVGAYIGFDLAHAVGNLPMHLHDDEVDFAVWCSYKYLNAGPGATAGLFVHDRIGQQTDFPRLSGWWGHDAKERFEMANRINPIPGVDGWQLSNMNILPGAALLASLSIFEEAGIDRLRAKSEALTGWLYSGLQQHPVLKKKITILTPGNATERGCQLSLYFPEKGKEVFDRLTEEGFVFDWREPNVIRVAPTPLYNTFREVQRFLNALINVLND